ncbi:MAG TPA: CCA tRNA nucleotidyltransferase [Thermoplasmata archaeon]|nr:CCA tRNA nucleotidyltransferase [Thermoplasmata archaeon]
MPPAEDEIEKIRGAVLDKVRPDAEDERKVKLAAEKLSEGIVKAAAARGVKCIPMLVGSVARGTWNRNPDLDIFILFPPDVSRGDLEKRGLELARAVMPDGEEKYAEHPYLNGVVDGLDIDIVPCYEIRDPSQRMTAVDRTPFHTEYMRTHLPPTMRDEVRTLKQFLKGIGVYGAESRVEGYSGFMTELLVLRYGGFLAALKAAAEWKPQVKLALETTDSKGPARQFPDAALVFLDPVDAERNAAAAVSADALAMLSYAARKFVEKPSLAFFFPPARKRRTVAQVSAEINRRGTHHIVLLAPKPDLIDDILYPQGRKAGARVAKGLEDRGFRVLRWSFGEEAGKGAKPSLVALSFELDRKSLASVRVHDGPPAWSEHAARFLEKWNVSPEAAGAPYLEGGKWKVVVRDKVTSARENLLSVVNSADMGKDLSPLLRTKGRVVEAAAAARLAVVESALFSRMPWEN